MVLTPHLFAITLLLGGFPFRKAETCQCGMENESNEGSYDDLYPKEEENMNRIQGGEYAPPNQYPWMVRLEPIGCGGSLISNLHVLTGRHCVTHAWTSPGVRNFDIDPRHNLVVWVGKHNISSNQSGYPVPVQSADWLNGSRHDIAMLVLIKPITFSKTVQPICLPPPTKFELYARCQAASSDEYDHNTTYIIHRKCGIQPVRALGWGEFGPNSGQHPTLKQLDPPAVYIDAYGSPEIYTSVQNISGQIHNICNGDSGGPLMYQDQETKKWTLIGTAALVGWFGDEHCTSTDGNFTSWTPVSAHYNWIQKHLSEAAGPSLMVSSIGPAATAQYSTMGVYFLTDQTFNNFPVYKMTGGGQFIYVDNDGYWSIWRELDPTIRGIMHPENNPTPSLPPFTGWSYYDSGWNDDEQLTVTETGDKICYPPHK